MITIIYKNTVNALVFFGLIVFSVHIVFMKSKSKIMCLQETTNYEL